MVQYLKLIYYLNSLNYLLPSLNHKVSIDIFEIQYPSLIFKYVINCEQISLPEPLSLFPYLQNGGNSPYFMEFWESKAFPIMSVGMTGSIYY